MPLEAPWASTPSGLRPPPPMGEDPIASRPDFPTAETVPLSYAGGGTPVRQIAPQREEAMKAFDETFDFVVVGSGAGSSAKIAPVKTNSAKAR